MVIATIIAIILILTYILFLKYNTIIATKQNAQSERSNITVMLDQRSKLFDSLTATINKYLEHEKGSLVDIIKLRQQIIQMHGDATTNQNVQNLEEQLSTMVSSGTISSGLHLTMEAYPELRSNNNMLYFQEEITKIERKLANQKLIYNEAVEEYMVSIESMPNVIIAGWFPKQLKEKFIRWELAEKKAADAEKQVVSF